MYVGMQNPTRPRTVWTSAEHAANKVSSISLLSSNSMIRRLILGSPDDAISTGSCGSLDTDRTPHRAILSEVRVRRVDAGET